MEQDSKQGKDWPGVENLKRDSYLQSWIEKNGEAFWDWQRTMVGLFLSQVRLLFALTSGGLHNFHLKRLDS